MLAIIDGLRTKLTALSDVVQGLASGGGESTVYTKRGDIYLSADGKVPAPKPGCDYSVWPLGAPFRSEMGYTDPVTYNKVKPWVARQSWVGLANLDINTGRDYDGGDVIPHMCTTGGDGLIAYNQEKNLVYYSINGITDWKIGNVPNNLVRIAGIAASPGHREIWLCGEFKNAEDVNVFLLYRANNKSLRDGLTWELNTDLSEVVTKNGKTMDDMLFLATDVNRGPIWSCLVNCSDNTRMLLGAYPLEPDVSPSFMQRVIPALTGDTVAGMSHGGDMVLIVTNNRTLLVDMGNVAADITSKDLSSYGDLTPVLDRLYLGNCPAFNTQLSSFIWVSQSGKLCKYNINTKVVDVYLTVDDLNITDPEITAYNAFKGYWSGYSNSLEIIMVNIDYTSSLSGNNGIWSEVYFARVSNASSSDERYSWRRVTPLGFNVYFSHPTYCHQTNKLFFLGGVDDNNNITNIWFSETWVSKIFTVPPVANGWWVEDRYERNEPEV